MRDVLFIICKRNKAIPFMVCCLQHYSVGPFPAFINSAGDTLAAPESLASGCDVGVFTYHVTSGSQFSWRARRAYDAVCEQGDDAGTSYDGGMPFIYLLLGIGVCTYSKPIGFHIHIWPGFGSGSPLWYWPKNGGI